MAHPLARPILAQAENPLAPARLLLLAVIAAAAVGGWLATAPATTAATLAQMGADWARLLRAMAALKLLFAAAASAATLWRLRAPIAAPRLAAYALAAAALWSGPGLIWGLDHIALGAALLHAGLLATVLLLWRDPALHALLSARVPALAARALAGRPTPRAAAAAPPQAAPPR